MSANTKSLLVSEIVFRYHMGDSRVSGKRYCWNEFVLTVVMMIMLKDGGDCWVSEGGEDSGSQGGCDESDEGDSNTVKGDQYYGDMQTKVW